MRDLRGPKRIEPSMLRGVQAAQKATESRELALLRWPRDRSNAQHQRRLDRRFGVGVDKVARLEPNPSSGELRPPVFLD